MRRFVITAIVAVAVAGLGATGASAAQPAAECGDPGATLAPPGFSTHGFANAETHYAGSEGTPSATNGSLHAVSQYDIACVHFTSSHTGG